MGTVETIIAADIALTRLINLIVDLMHDDDDETIEELIAEADAMDERRKAMIDKIKARKQNGSQ